MTGKHRNTKTATATRRLILLRHAKSAWDTGDVDFDRPLAPRGRRAAARCARWLARYGGSIDLVLCSPARRAVETCGLVLEHLDRPTVEHVAAIYEADRADLLQVLASAPAGDAGVMIVGHNPGLDLLLEWLLPQAPPRTPKSKLMTTAALALLAVPRPWDRLRRGGAELEALIRPKALNREGELVR